MGNVRTIPAERSDKAPFAAARPADPRAPEQHSIGRFVVLHLLPGALITLLFALTAPVARGLGCWASSPTASRRRWSRSCIPSYLLPRLARFGGWAPLSKPCSFRSITSARPGSF